LLVTKICGGVNDWMGNKAFNRFTLTTAVFIVSLPTTSDISVKPKSYLLHLHSIVLCPSLLSITAVSLSQRCKSSSPNPIPIPIIPSITPSSLQKGEKISHTSTRTPTTLSSLWNRKPFATKKMLCRQSVKHPASANAPTRKPLFHFFFRVASIQAGKFSRHTKNALLLI